MKTRRLRKNKNSRKQKRKITGGSYAFSDDANMYIGYPITIDEVVRLLSSDITSVSSIAASKRLPPEMQRELVSNLNTSLIQELIQNISTVPNDYSIHSDEKKYNFIVEYLKKTRSKINYYRFSKGFHILGMQYDGLYIYNDFTQIDELTNDLREIKEKFIREAQRINLNINQTFTIEGLEDEPREVANPQPYVMIC